MPNNPIRSIAFACAAFFGFSMMSVLNKMVADFHHPIEVSFYRNIAGLLPLIIMVLWRPDIKQVLTVKRPWLVTFRCIIGVLTLFVTLAATQYLPLSDATTLFFVSTLVTPIIAITILKEKVGHHRLIAVAFGLTGVIIVAQPSGQFHIIGTICALLAGVGHATVQTCVRALREEDSLTLNFYFFLSGVLMSAIFLPFLFTPPTLINLFIMFGVGLAALFGQWCLIQALRNGEASLVNPFNYTGLIWAVIFDVLIWQAWPSMNVWMGASIIICANLYILYREQQKTQGPQDS